MEQRTNHIRTRENEQVEERSLTSDFLTGAATTAGGLTVIGVVTQGKQVAGKVVDKIKTKDKDE